MCSRVPNLHACMLGTRSEPARVHVRNALPACITSIILDVITAIAVTIVTNVRTYGRTYSHHRHYRDVRIIDGGGVDIDDGDDADDDDDDDADAALAGSLSYDLGWSPVPGASRPTILAGRLFRGPRSPDELLESRGSGSGCLACLRAITGRTPAVRPQRWCHWFGDGR